LAFDIILQQPFLLRHNARQQICAHSDKLQSFLSSFEMSGKTLLAASETKTATANRMATAPNLSGRVRRSNTWVHGHRSNHKSVRKVAVSIGETTRSSRINTAEDGENSSLRGDFFKSRAVLATRTERVRVSSKSMLQWIALEKKLTKKRTIAESQVRAESSPDDLGEAPLQALGAVPQGHQACEQRASQSPTICNLQAGWYTRMQRKLHANTRQCIEFGT
jgi:hypothetical protein